MANFPTLTSDSTNGYFHAHLFDYHNISSLSSSLNDTEDFISINTYEYNWPVLLLSVLSIFGILGNLLVCASISLDKQLQTVTNFFLFSLAIADCLLSLIVLPLAIIKDFQGKYDIHTRKLLLMGGSIKTC